MRARELDFAALGLLAFAGEVVFTGCATTATGSCAGASDRATFLTSGVCAAGENVTSIARRSARRTTREGGVDAKTATSAAATRQMANADAPMTEAITCSRFRGDIVRRRDGEVRFALGSGVIAPVVRRLSGDGARDGGIVFWTMMLGTGLVTRSAACDRAGVVIMLSATSDAGNVGRRPAGNRRFPMLEAQAEPMPPGGPHDSPASMRPASGRCGSDGVHRLAHPLGARVDRWESAFYVEAKQYGDEDGARKAIRDGARQIWNSADRVRVRYPMREAFLVVFRRGGPHLRFATDEVRSGDIVVRPVLVDVAGGKVSGSRTPSVIHITAEQLLAELRAAARAEPRPPVRGASPPKKAKAVAKRRGRS